MDTTVDEVTFIGPAYKRQPDSIHRGFWTPELAEWREDIGYREIRDLQSYAWSGNVKVTSAAVNASPILCVTKTQLGQNDLVVTTTYSIGVPNPNENIVSGDTVISGFTVDHQYNEPIYRRAWVTGGTAGVYPATYSFTDETDGTSGTDIDFVDDATLYDGECIIISEWQGHRNVLRLQDDATPGEDPIIRHDFIQANAGVHEFWIGTNNVTEDWQFGTFEVGQSWIIRLRINGSKFQYYDSLDVWQDCGQVAVNNIIYHCKIIWYADNTFDFYVNGSILQDGVACNNIQVVGSDRFLLRAVGDSVDYIYLDAYGETEDPNYTVGDNLTQGLNPFTYEFTIPAYTKPGKVYRLPNKRTYKINDISVSGGIADQPLTRLGFYALADNGSKLLYSLNWNKIFEYGRTALYGAYGNPDKCPRCAGSGYVADPSDTCVQCGGYKYDGPNASGFLERQIGLDYGLIKDNDTTNDEFRNKIWAMNWWVTPTKKEIQRYFSHFARIEDDEIEVNNVDRISTGPLPTGVEKAVDILLPYTIPFAVFDKADKIWNQMAESIEPAGIDIRFSFLIAGFSGSWEWVEWESVYTSGFVSAKLTGLQPENWVAGFSNPIFNMDHGSNSFYSEWGEDWFFFNHLCESIHPSGYISGTSGIQLNSGTTYSWESGALESGAWLKWVEISGSDGKANIWSTGDGIWGFVQDAMWVSGTYYLDNFWVSGLDGIQY